MTLVLRNCDLDTKGIIFNEPKPSGHGGQTIYVNYQKDDKMHKTCLIQTPWLYNPFGLNSSPAQPGEEPKYYIEPSFGTAPTTYVQDFQNKMKALDQHVINSAITNQKTWLSRTDIDDEYIEEFYKTIVRPYKNKEKKATGEYPDTVRFKIPYYTKSENGGAGDGDDDAASPTSTFSDMEVYDANRQKVVINSIDDLRSAIGKGNRIRAIVQCHSVWQSGKEFGVSWRVKRIQVLNADNGLGDQCAFSTNSDEEEEIGAGTTQQNLEQDNSDEQNE